MLDHYLMQEELSDGGMLVYFVSLVKGLSYGGVIENTNFRLETVIFGGLLGSLYAVLQFFLLLFGAGYLTDLAEKRYLVLLLLAPQLAIVCGFLQMLFGFFCFPGQLGELPVVIFPWQQQQLLM